MRRTADKKWKYMIHFAQTSSTFLFISIISLLPAHVIIAACQRFLQWQFISQSGVIRLASVGLRQCKFLLNLFPSKPRPSFTSSKTDQAGPWFVTSDECLMLFSSSKLGTTKPCMYFCICLRHLYLAFPPNEVHKTTQWKNLNKMHHNKKSCIKPQQTSWPLHIKRLPEF